MPVATSEQTGRRRVLDAAAELLVAQGYAGTTLREIAAAVGIKAGSIYHHFDSKDAIFVSVFNDGIEVMLAAFETAAERLPAEASSDERLLAHVHGHLSAVFENGPYTTAHVTSFFTAPDEVRSQVVPQRDLYENGWSELLLQLFPEFSPSDLRLHRLILFGAMNATAEWFDVEGVLSLEQLAAAITHQFLHGVEA